MASTSSRPNALSGSSFARRLSASAVASSSGLGPSSASARVTVAMASAASRALCPNESANAVTSATRAQSLL